DDARPWASVLAPDRADGKRVARASGHGLRYPRLAGGERRVLASLAGKRQLRLGGDRYANIRTNCVIEIEAQQHRLARVARDHLKRQDHTGLVADRLAAFVIEAMWRRKRHCNICHVVGTVETKARRHARITGIAPISLPTGPQPYFDAGAQRPARSG